MRSDPETSLTQVLHLRIADAAVRRGYMTLTEAGRRLLKVGANTELDALELWCDESGLDITELRSIQDEIARSATLAPAAEFALDEDDGQRDELPTHDRHHTFEDAGTIRKSASSSKSSVSSHPEFARGIATNVDAAERYELGAELGRGGAGLVMRAYDRNLGRVVAIKVPRAGASASYLQRFWAEARLTAGLEHPNIVPIHDMGTLEDGRSYYAMKRMQGVSLRAVLQQLKAEDPQAEMRWSRRALLQVMISVCRAVEFAHARGYVHRDLKPENIMLGDFGEVHVMDWGLAVRVGEEVGSEQQKDELHAAGTPAYMSPEQATGGRTIMEPTSDVYTLGVMLYEVLTLTVPSRRGTAMETMLAVVSEPVLPPSKVAVERELSDELDDIVMRALEKQPGARWKGVADLRERLEQYLDGRRSRVAQRLHDESQDLIAAWDRGFAELERQRAAGQARYVDAIIGDNGIAQHRPYWRALERVGATTRHLARLYQRALRLLHLALREDPEHHASRRALCDLYWRRHNWAEQIRDVSRLTFYRAQLRMYDDERRYIPRFDGTASVEVFSEPTGAEVFLYRLEPREFRIESRSFRYLGQTPLRLNEVDLGSWLILIKKPGCSTSKYHLNVRHAKDYTVHVRLPERGRIPMGSEFVPAGTSIIGGDIHALDPLPWGEVEVREFVLATAPVTIQQYVQFLDDLFDDEERWQERVPCIHGKHALFERVDGKTGFNPRALRALRARPEAAACTPIVGISPRCAEQYVRWLTARSDFPLRLPTEIEWERAARGADGRFFPWGDGFDPAFCASRLSYERRMRLSRVGAFPTDVGPFGHFDMVGNVAEITAGTHHYVDGYVLRGGSWRADENVCRAASRRAIDVDTKSDEAGFRLVYEVPLSRS